MEKIDSNIKPTGCCEIFNPEPWDNKILEWDNKKFVKGKVRTLFFMPLNFGKVIVKMMNQIKAASTDVVDSMGLSDHTSKWNMDIYLAVDREIPGIENVSLSGKFFSKVYEGDFKKTGEWCKDFEKLAKDRGFDIKKWYMWYTTCPKCAKVYGKNFTVIIAKID
jgi:hypothetical protein